MCLKVQLLQQRFFTPGWIYTLEYKLQMIRNFIYETEGLLWQGEAASRREATRVCYDVLWCVNSIKAFADLSSQLHNIVDKFQPRSSVENSAT